MRASLRVRGTFFKKKVDRVGRKCEVSKEIASSCKWSRWSNYILMDYKIGPSVRIFVSLRRIVDRMIDLSGSLHWFFKTERYFFKIGEEGGRG